MNNSKNKAPESYPGYQDGIFKYRDDGFTVAFPEGFLSVSWSEIKYIYAYKIDLFTIDCIVIEIHLNEKTFEITEETEGYMKFMDMAAFRLPNFNKNWYEAVIAPAFKANQTLVYER